MTRPWRAAAATATLTLLFVLVLNNAQGRGVEIDHALLLVGILMAVLSIFGAVHLLRGRQSERYRREHERLAGPRPGARLPP